MNRIFLLISLVGISHTILAQKLDSTFQADITGRASVELVDIQSDDKILMYADLVKIAGVSTHNGKNGTLIRTNTDGSLDNSFQKRLFKDSSLTCIKSLSNGQILVAGFDRVGSKDFVLRLNNNGTTDNDFVLDSTLILDGSASAMAEMNNDYLFGSKNWLIRISKTGLLIDIDTIPHFFAVNQPLISGIVTTVSEKIIVFGRFNKYDDSPENIIRLNSDGSLDHTFNIGRGASNSVYSVVIQDDGKLLISGNFSRFNDTQVEKIIRLNIDGSLDPSFIYDDNFSVEGRVLILSSGKFLVMGSSLLKLYSANGELLQSSVLSGGKMKEMKKNSNNEVFLFGDFGQRYESGYRSGAIMLDSSLTIDYSFDAKLEGKPIIREVELTENGKILIRGDFLKVNNENIFGFAQLNPDGSLDDEFSTEFLTDRHLGYNPYDIAGTILPLSSGKFLVANGHLLMRLNHDGSIDNSFSCTFSGSYTNQGIFNGYEQDDGKIIITGSFNSVNGIGRHNLARINVDGTLDESFNTSDTIDFRILAIESIEGTNSYYIAGHSLNENGNIKKINSKGEIDESFLLESTFIPSIEDIAIQSDGGVAFSAFSTAWSTEVNNEIPKVTFGRFHPNGSFDTNFRATIFRSHELQTIIGGKLLLSGRHENTGRYEVIITNSEGKPSPVLGLDTDGTIYDIYLDGENVFFAGNFTYLGDETHYGLAKASISEIEENGAPVILDYQFSFPEDTLIGSIIGKIEAIDPEGDIVRFEVLEGNEDDFFQLLNNGRIRLESNSGLDASAKSEFNLLTNATDGVNSTLFYININVIDVPQILSLHSASEGVKLYPNPAETELTVYGSNLKSVIVYDMMGKKVIEETATFNSEMTVYMSSLMKGMYIVEIHTEDGVLKRKVLKN